MQPMQTGALDALPRMKYPCCTRMCSCQINMLAVGFELGHSAQRKKALGEKKNPAISL